jgi:hypothetical protein
MESKLERAIFEEMVKDIIAFVRSWDAQKLDHTPP